MPGASEATMADATSSRPQVNGILETSLYVEGPTQSVEFYRRVFGFKPTDTDQKEGSPMRRDCVQCVPVTAAYSCCSRKALQQTQTQQARSTPPSPFPDRNYQHGRHGCPSRGLRLS